jgi:hypothetical protein
MENNIKNLNREIKNECNRFKNGWIPLGMKLCELENTIEKGKGITWKSEFKVKNFPEYCDKVLSMDYVIMLKIRTAAQSLNENRTQLYEQYLKDKTTIIPGYSLIHLVESKRKRLEDKNKYDEIIKNLYDDGMLRREIESNIRKILKADSTETNSRSSKSTKVVIDNIMKCDILQTISYEKIPSMQNDVEEVFGSEDERNIEIKNMFDAITKILLKYSEDIVKDESDDVEVV